MAEHEKAAVPSQYIKRPVTVEAVRLTEDPTQRRSVYRWVEEHTGSFCPTSPEPATSGVAIDPGSGHVLIATLEGVMVAQPGDWIIRGIKGEFYPCKPEIFTATYGPAQQPGRTAEAGHAISTVARDALARHPRELLWEDYPVIGEHDWSAVIDRADEIAEDMMPSAENLQAALALLASRADAAQEES